ncbi:MAG: hypothetical protein ACOCV3_00360 [Halanaerobiales bacterium]
MKNKERIKQALKETEILKEPDDLISTSDSTRLHYYVLTEPIYLEAFPDEGPETRIREGWITWDKPKLLTPGYIMKMEGFSKEAEQALKMLASKHPDQASLLYKMRYRKKAKDSRTVPHPIKNTAERLKDDFDEASDLINVIIKGVDELWDVSLLKFIQEFILQSAQHSQLPDYKDKGYLAADESGIPRVTRNFEGLPLAAGQEIEKMFEQVKKGEIDPSRLKQELDRWGVYKQYEDRFLDLFRG